MYLPFTDEEGRGQRENWSKPAQLVRELELDCRYWF